MVFLIHTELRCTVNHTSDFNTDCFLHSLNRLQCRRTIWSVTTEVKSVWYVIHVQVNCSRDSVVSTVTGLRTGRLTNRDSIIGRCITYLLTPWSRVLLEKPTGSQLVKKFPTFYVTPEGSLPHSQVSATCPFPKPGRSSPYPHIPLPDDPF